MPGEPMQKLRSPVALVFELLLPVVLIVLFGLATMAGSPFQTTAVESYRFSDPAYEGCPAGMYGASLQPGFPTTSGTLASRLGPDAAAFLDSLSDADVSLGDMLCSGVLSAPTLQRSNPLSALAVLLAFPFVQPYEDMIHAKAPIFVVRDESGNVVPHLDHPFAEFMNQVSEAVFGTEPVLTDAVLGPVPRPTAASYIHFDAKESYSFHLHFNDFGSDDSPMDVEVFGPFGSTQLSGSDQVRSGFFIPFYSFTYFPNNLDPFGQSENPVSQQAVHRLLLAYARWLEAGKVLTPGQAMHGKEAWVFILRNQLMNKRLTADRFIEPLLLKKKMNQIETICNIVVQANRSDFSEAKDTSLRLRVNQYFKLFRTDPVVQLWKKITDSADPDVTCGLDTNWRAFTLLINDASTFNDIPADSSLGPDAAGVLTFRSASQTKQYAEDLFLSRLVTPWDRATISKFLPTIIPNAEGFTEHAFPNREGYYSLFGEFFSTNPSGNFFFLAGLCVVVDRIARTVMLDKELKIFSFLSVFGASRAQYFASVYTFFGIYYIFLCLAMTGATFYPYQSPNFFVVCFGLWLSVLQLTSWTIFVCSFFRQPSLAAYTSIFTILFGGSIQLFVDQLNSRSIDIFICILPQNAILRANSLYLAFQMWTVGSPHGISIYDIAKEFEGVAIIYVWCMSVVGAVVWFLLGTYVALVFPKDDTTRRPWHFPVTMWFSSLKEGELDASPTETVTPSYFQQDTSTNEVFATLQNVRKSFPGKGGAKEVVRGVSFTLKQNEIFVLLGHNGAGKTTTIRMIIGELGLSAGEIGIGGHSMVTDRSRARGSLGYCPQHGVLFPFMTVKEHFNMIGLLKGVEKQARRQQIDEALDTLGLTSKVDSRTSALSGGQQRRVSVGMALMGDSRVILLDEPTTGMDPHTRRGFWRAVERVRDSGRAVLLTTHFMDEADQLADNVGIMHSGLIRCQGSPVFLKRLLHVAYNISVTLTESSPSTLARTTRGLQTASSEIRLTRQNAKEATFSLKTAGDLAAVIGALEDGAVEGVSSFSLSGPSLEAVFLRVAACPDDLNVGADATPRRIGPEEDVFTKYAEIAKQTPHSQRMLQMFTGLYWRRYKLYSRSLSSVVMQVLLPCLLVVVVGAAMKVIDLGLSPQLVSGGHLNLGSSYPLKPMVTIPVSSDFPCLTNPPPGYTFIDSGVTSKAHMDDYLLSEFKFQRGEIMPAFAFTKDGLWYNENQYGRAFAHAMSSWDMCHLNIQKDIRIAQTMRTTLLFERIIDTIMDTNASVYTVIAVSIAPAYWSYLLGSERVNGQRRMLAMAGANPSIFWLAEFMVDYTSYLLSVVFVLFTVWIFGMALLRNGACFAATAVSILVFPCAMGPVSFICSLLFNKPLAGFFVVYMCCFIFAMLPSFFSIFLIERDWNILKYFFYLIPPSCLSIVLSTVSQFGV
ncbi:MAG: uncharacterized protein KVP18_001616 [Porospora cf. gigantea A]|uniref:uncharacterized protein n=1 Tax=Porospora cf. gigantea A TaxID=2853593 RepID=UPI00355A8807|nr:MAG: hypothetical protein KVP18_001616 [Porospora cf. gigantea A]